MISTKQAAITWWRLLLAELESSAVMKTPGPAGLAARHRVNGLRELFFSLLSNSQIELLVEVGAKEAETSRRFVQSQPRGRALAFEAAPETYRKTLEVGIPERMELVNCAVGAHVGEATFFLPLDEKVSAWGSTRKRLLENIAVREFTVPMTTLDRIAPPAQQKSPSRDAALWIDVEGAILDVLSGGAEFIRNRVGWIYMEVYDFDVYEGSGNILQVLETLLKAGFVPVGRDNQFQLGWNLLVGHEDLYCATHDTIAKWMYRQRSPKPPAVS